MYPKTKTICCINLRCDNEINKDITEIIEEIVTCDKCNESFLVKKVEPNIWHSIPVKKTKRPSDI